MKKRILIILISALTISGCSVFDHEHAVDTTNQESNSVAVTQWNDNMEIFMEYETAVIGEEIKFIIHLTTLADFQPVRDGKVILTFNAANGSDISFGKEELLREGIFTPTYTFKSPGDYNFRIKYQGSKTTSSFNIGSFTVYQKSEDIPTVEEEVAGEDITFLKEQQWKIDFATEEVRTRPVKTVVQAVGEIRPRPASYAEIVSPVDGLISITSANRLVKPGQRISKGQTMAILVPPLTAQNNWAETYLRYDQAKKEFERAKRLQERNAISEREFDQAKNSYEMLRAGFSNYFDTDEGGISYNSNNQQFVLTAPINGIVSDVTVLPGQKIDQNQKLFSIVDPSIVWLRIDLFAEQAALLSEIAGLSIKIPGKDRRINLDETDFSVISQGQLADPKTGTVSLWLEVLNRQREFLIGQKFTAQIYTNPARNMRTVPLTAIYDDNSQKILFVHISGESFEKREVETGPIYHDYIGIKNGVTEGERIVSRGGYQVKLASTSEEIGHPHTH